MNCSAWILYFLFVQLSKPYESRHWSVPYRATSSKEWKLLKYVLEILWHSSVCVGTAPISYLIISVRGLSLLWLLGLNVCQSLSFQGNHFFLFHWVFLLFFISISLSALILIALSFLLFVPAVCSCISQAFRCIYMYLIWDLSKILRVAYCYKLSS